MKRKVLLPTDFSKNSWRAIEYATMLYANEDCLFYLLNVFSIKSKLREDIVNTASESELYETVKKQSENRLEKIVDKLILNSNGDPKHQFKAISVFSKNIVKAIKNVVEQKDIEMIVMGTKGETNAREFVFGSTAVTVMEKARNCPVIVVPLKAKTTLPKEIVFPTGYKMHYKRRELSYLTHIAKKCNANIAILHISEENGLSKDQKNHKKLLEEIFEEVTFSNHLLSHYSVETAVNIFTESRDSDMVAFINKKHAFFGSMLSNPLVKGITFHSKVPILVMHDLKN